MLDLGGIPCTEPGCSIVVSSGSSSLIGEFSARHFQLDYSRAKGGHNELEELSHIHLVELKSMVGFLKGRKNVDCAIEATM